MTHEQIAEVTWEANRVYCQSIGDNTQPHWEQAPKILKDSVVDGVKAVAEGRIAKPGDSHKNWLEYKEKEGWKYGPVENPVTKTHPCMFPFEDLPADQQIKDHLFVGIVKTLLYLPKEATASA